MAALLAVGELSAGDSVVWSVAESSDEIKSLAAEKSKPLSSPSCSGS